MTNPFKDWTPAMVAAHNARSGKPDEPLLPHQKTSITLPPSVRADMQIKPQTEEQKLNKAERAFLAVLRAEQRLGNVSWIGIQNITIKIGDDCRFTPDFWAIVAGKLKAYDVKAAWKGNKPHVEDDAKAKIQVAARTYRFIEFVTCWKHDGQWNYKVSKP